MFLRTAQYAGSKIIMFLTRQIDLWYLDIYAVPANGNANVGMFPVHSLKTQSKNLQVDAVCRGRYKNYISKFKVCKEDYYEKKLLPPSIVLFETFLKLKVAPFFAL